MRITNKKKYDNLLLILKEKEDTFLKDYFKDKIIPVKYYRAFRYKVEELDNIKIRMARPFWAYEKTKPKNEDIIKLQGYVNAPTLKEEDIFLYYEREIKMGLCSGANRYLDIIKERRQK